MPGIMERQIVQLQYALTALALSAVLYGCSWISPSVQSGDVLFQDDFGINSSGWDRYRDDLYQANYDQGIYQIEVFSPETMAWSLPDLSYSDVILRVQAWRGGGPEDNLFGLICRYQDPDNFIFFVISSDGYAGIGAYIQGVRTLLTDKSLLPVDAIRPGDNINLLEARCAGRELSLSVNGQRAAQASIDEIVEGDVGLLVGTYADGGVEIRFDNFSMLQP